MHILLDSYIILKVCLQRHASVLNYPDSIPFLLYQSLTHNSVLYISHDILSLFLQPEILSDMTQTTPEEAEDRFERIIIASLNSIGNLSKALTLEENILLNQGGDSTECSLGYKEVFSEKFWSSIVSHKNILIRRSAYDVISVICVQAPSSIHSQVQKNVLSMQKLSNIFCQFLDEKNLQNIPSVFMAFLSFLRAFPASFSTIKIDSLVTRLFVLLESSTSCTLEYLLPIFGSIPCNNIAMYATAVTANNTTACTVHTNTVGQSADIITTNTDVTATTVDVNVDVIAGSALTVPVSRGAVTTNKCLANLLISVRTMTERRTVPEELLASADLCVLECSTLLLLRRTSATAAVSTIDESSGTFNQVEEEMERDESKGAKRKERKENKKNKGGQDTLSVLQDNLITEPEGEVEVEVENELLVEEVTGMLCRLIFESVALLTSATAKIKPKTLRTYEARTGGKGLDARTESITYAPYVAMRRVLIQLNRASCLGINLSPSQWVLSLWGPLANALDRQTHTHLLEKVSLEGGDVVADVADVTVEVGSGEEEEVGEYYPDPADESDYPDRLSGMQSQGENGQGELGGEKRSVIVNSSGTKKQREKKNETCAAILSVGIAAHSYLIRIVVDVVRVIVEAEGAMAVLLPVSTNSDKIDENVKIIDNNQNGRIDSCSLLSDLLTSVSGRLNLFSVRAITSDVTRATQTALRSSLTAQFAIDLLKLSTIPTTSISNNVGVKLQPIDVLSDWLLCVCTIIQMGENDVHPILSDILSTRFRSILISIDSIPLSTTSTSTSGGDDMRVKVALSVLSYCFKSLSLRSLNIAMSTPLCSSLVTNFSQESSSNLGPRSAMEYEELLGPGSPPLSIMSVNSLLSAISIAILSIDKESEKEGEKGGVKGTENTMGSGKWSPVLMIEKSDLIDRVRFSSLLALSQVGVKKLSDGVFRCAVSVWKESRSKVGMWVVLSVIAENLKSSYLSAEVVKGRESDVTPDWMPSELSEMLLSAFFSRKETYRTKPPLAGNVALNVIICWDDVKNILFPLLPECSQIEFSTGAISSLSLMNLFVDNSHLNKVEERKESDYSGVVESERSNEENVGVTFLPRKWARHMSSLMSLAATGLLISRPNNLKVAGSVGFGTSSVSDTILGTRGGGRGSVGGGVDGVCEVVSSVGLGQSQCWSTLSSSASSLLQSISTDIKITSGAITLFLQKAQYILLSLLQLDEMWKIERGSGESMNEWLCVASDAALCEELLISLSYIKHFCVTVRNVLPSASGINVSTSSCAMSVLSHFNALCPSCRILNSRNC